MDWARVIRGIDSIAKLVMPPAASDLASAASVSGARKPISTWPDFSRPTSSWVGVATRSTTSAPQASSSLAPASL